MRRAALAALVLLLGTLVACSNDSVESDPVESDSANRRVLVLGDSNLFISGGAVDAALREVGFKPRVHGPPGYGLRDFDEYWADKLTELLDFDPAVVVIGLGTNDTKSAEDVFLVPARIDQMMEAIGDREVIWITHVDDRPGADDPRAGMTVNRSIRAAVDRWENLVILDFTEVIAGDPDVLIEDGVHLSRKGIRIYGRSIADAVLDVYDRCKGDVVAGCA